MKKSIRLSDVARVAGVSVGTVSNTFNKPELVRPEVRDLVHATARKLDYSGPDPKGRLLMGGKTNTIGVLLPGDISVTHSVKSPYFHDFMLGIAEVCDENSASLMIVSGAEERKNWAIRNALVDGFILGHVDEVGLISLRHKEVPFVVMDMDAGPGVNSVRIEARSGARRAAEHLLALGHRKFAIVSVLRKSTPPILHAPASSARQLVKAYPLDQDKLLGYQDALETAGISINDVAIIESFVGSPGREAGAAMLLDRVPEATAILAMADILAIAVLDEAHRRGISVPHDVSIVGFDNISEAVARDLTTVAQPTVEKGRIAARILFDGRPPRHDVLPVELIIRSSTSRPRP